MLGNVVTPLSLGNIRAEMIQEGSRRDPGTEKMIDHVMLKSLHHERKLHDAGTPSFSRHSELPQQHIWSCSASGRGVSRHLGAKGNLHGAGAQTAAAGGTDSMRKEQAFGDKTLPSRSWAEPHLRCGLSSSLQEHGESGVRSQEP